MRTPDRLTSLFLHTYIEVFSSGCAYVQVHVHVCLHYIGSYRQPRHATAKVSICIRVHMHIYTYTSQPMYVEACLHVPLCIFITLLGAKNTLRSYMPHEYCIHAYIHRHMYIWTTLAAYYSPRDKEYTAHLCATSAYPRPAVPLTLALTLLHPN